MKEIFWCNFVKSTYLAFIASLFEHDFACSHCLIGKGWVIFAFDSTLIIYFFIKNILESTSDLSSLKLKKNHYELKFFTCVKFSYFMKKCYLYIRSNITEKPTIYNAQNKYVCTNSIISKNMYQGTKCTKSVIGNLLISSFKSVKLHNTHRHSFTIPHWNFRHL